MAQIAYMAIEFRVPSAHSLKDKRRIVKSLKDRLRQRYNISIAEIDRQDSHQHGVIGLTMIGTERNQLDSMISSIHNQLSEMRDILLVDVHREWL